MSRPRNDGAHAWTRARKRRTEIRKEREAHQGRIATLDEEDARLAEFLDLCEQLANETPADPPRTPAGAAGESDAPHTSSPAEEQPAESSPAGKAEQGESDGETSCAGASPGSADDVPGPGDPRGSAADPSKPRTRPDPGPGQPSAGEALSGNGSEAAPDPFEIPTQLRRGHPDCPVDAEGKAAE